MKIQIYGAGIAGSYLYCLLSGRLEVGIVDRRSEPDCRCGWGIYYSEARELYGRIGIDFDRYVLCKPRYLIVNNVRFRNMMVSFDRKHLLEDLWREIEFKSLDNPDLIIDATGYERAFLPKIENDSLYYTIQMLEVHECEENIYIYSSRFGYAWAIPLSNNRWHIGAGGVSEEYCRKLLNNLRIQYGFKAREPICMCKARVRLLPPSRCKPIINGKVVGVGEAIGCVSGFGEGNTPSLKSALILSECILNNALERYEEEISREFKWIELEHEFVRAVQEGNKVKTLKLLPKVLKIEGKRLFKPRLETIIAYLKQKL